MIRTREFLTRTSPPDGVDKIETLWPLRQPDITPLDFFLKGIIDRVSLTNSVPSLDELKHRIQFQ